VDLELREFEIFIVLVSWRQQAISSALGAITLESRTECSILVREVQDMLREACSLDDAADLDRAFFLDELSDRVQKVRGEL
jgi:hypothetical protein